MTSASLALPDTSDGFLPLLRRRAQAEPDRIFARFEGQPITFSEIDRQASALAAWLADAGLKPRDRVALMLRNGPLALAMLFAIARARAVWVPINPQSRGSNLAYILGHAAPRLIVCEDDLAQTVRSSAPVEGARLRIAGEAASMLLSVPQASAREAAAPDADDTYAVMYTSGTTGPPKGVLVSHRMLRIAGEAAMMVADARDGDVMFMWEPLYHIGGAQLLVLPLIRDVTLAMVTRFSASRFWDEVRREHATHIHFLGGILQMLLRQPASDLDRQHRVRVAWGGGCPREVWRPFEERFGVEIHECYGMTECSSITTISAPGVVGSVGRPAPWFRVELVGPDGEPARPDEKGEIVVGTTLPGALTRGYLDNPEATGRAFRGGAFHTGDLGSRDADGNLYFHGRMTDSVRVKGENVSAFEVEHVAAQHPDVEDCAMIGVAADIGEQDIKLFVKLRDGATLAPEQFSAWLAARLAPYQQPRYIVVVPDFERTPSQRIMKHRLATLGGQTWDRLAEASDPKQV
jgi:crotonobetaine/carnitine-CoA ligase